MKSPGKAGWKCVPYRLVRGPSSALALSLSLSAEAQIRFDQLSLGLLWAQLFQDANTQPGDIVAFDIYCGDLNFDNCSSGGGAQLGAGQRFPGCVPTSLAPTPSTLLSP